MNMMPGQLQVNALQLFEATAPLVAQTNNDRLKALMGDMGGDSRNRLSIKAGRFRQIVGGNEIYVHPMPMIDVVILGAVPYVSRTYYAGQYQEGVDAKPACSSANGVDSDATVENRQSAKCEGCPQNMKGAKTNQDGSAGKACRYYKRVAVMVWGDPEGRVYQLDLPAASIFGDGKPQQGKLSFSAYAKLLGQRGIDPLGIVTRIEFDMSASAPQLLFSPAVNQEGTAIQFVPQEHLPAFVALSDSQPVKDICVVAAPGTVVQSAPALAAPVQVAQLQAPAPVVPAPVVPAAPPVQQMPQVPQMPAAPAVSPNVPVMPSIPAMPPLPAAPGYTPQAPAAAATAPVSAPVMPTAGASVTNVAVPAPAVAAVPAMPQIPVMPSAPTAPTPQAVAAAPAPAIEVTPMLENDVTAWLNGLAKQ